MARGQTVFSELTVGLGINSNKLNSISNVDKAALEKYNAEKIKRDKSTKEGEVNSGKNLEASGKLIRNWLINRKKISGFDVDWVGEVAVKDRSLVAKDLVIRDTDIRISVKEEAHLFQNPSPEQVFQKWPQGILLTTGRAPDWFVNVAGIELNDYFRVCGGEEITNHKTVQDYYKNEKGSYFFEGRKIKKRKKFTTHVANLHKQKKVNVLEAYRRLCLKVSEETAKIFCNNIANTFPGIQSDCCDVVLLTNIFSVFFKLDDTEYILAGTENNKPFAVVVDDINTWRKNFKVQKIEALALVAGQPEVLITFEFVEKRTNNLFTYSIRCEVRWSHGKFCGNPESKLYKHNKWRYDELPWVTVL